MSENETTEMWREYGRTRQTKRARNRENAAQILNLNSIEFESKNGGAHLIVESSLGKIDFWPGTGLFIPRSTGRRGRGVGNLVKLVGIDLIKDPDSTAIAHVDLTETEARLAAHIEQETAETIQDSNADKPINPPWD